MNAQTSKPSISFDEDSQLVQQLLAMLVREQSSLVMIDIDAIEAVLEEKSVLLQRMHEVATTRYQALANNGFAASEAGMLAWLAQLGKPSMNNLWDSFQKSLLQAKETNRLNGMLINKHFNRNQQVLNHLQGGVNAGSVYGRDGQAKAQPNTRPSLTA
jgi:flagella synthesis protein FlgN